MLFYKCEDHPQASFKTTIYTGLDFHPTNLGGGGFFTEKIYEGTNLSHFSHFQNIFWGEFDHCMCHFGENLKRELSSENIGGFSVKNLVWYKFQTLS